MSGRAELVSQLTATLAQGLDSKQSKRILRALEEDLLIPAGLYLVGGLSPAGGEPGLSPEIAGLVTRADGRDITERDTKRVEAWLASTPQVREFSMSAPRPATRADVVKPKGREA